MALLVQDEPLRLAVCPGWWALATSKGTVDKQFS